MKGHTRRTLIGAMALLAAFAPAALGSADATRPTLTITPKTVAYGTGSVLLSGTVPSGKAGEVVSIMAKACLFTEAAEIGTVRTKKGGAFRYAVQPMLNTAFSARWNNATSSSVSVGVTPAVSVKPSGAGRYRIEVATTNPVFQDGRRVVLQRAAGSRWANVASGTLEKASPETAITVVSAAVVSAQVPKGSRLRAVLSGAQARCYRTGTSAEITA